MTEINVPRREIDRIICRVASQTGVTVSEIEGRSRLQYINLARQRVMWEAYQTGVYTTTQIGIRLNRDHTTVIFGCRAHARRLTKTVQNPVPMLADL